MGDQMLEQALIENNNMTGVINEALLGINPHNIKDLDSKSFNMSESISKNMSLDKGGFND